MPQPFCKLANPSSYRACNWNLSIDPIGRRYWVDLFKRHFETILTQGTSAAIVRGGQQSTVMAKADQARQNLHGQLDRFSADPASYDPVTILTLDFWRDQCLREAGFRDAFIDLKNRENGLSLPLLPTVCRQLDALEGDEQFQAIIEGVFAGNIFDMGSEATAKAYLHDSPDFFATRQRIKPRPWLIDDYDALADRLLCDPHHRKAVFFIDNAGSDFILGAVPMMRWLAQRGTHVVLAANERPTLNDMTVHDVRDWWPRILAAEPSLAGLSIEIISTGTGEPLIDLSQVSKELNDASANADLVILEGMGRGVESNLDARFSCDALNIAMLKDVAVAGRLGGGLYDVVCRFKPGMG